MKKKKKKALKLILFCLQIDFISESHFSPKDTYKWDEQGFVKYSNNDLKSSKVLFVSCN